MNDLGNKISEMASLAYKNRFSIYYQPDECLVRTYFKDGSQHKETGKTIEEAVSKMISFLKGQ
jgi:hypothetical protein